MPSRITVKGVKTFQGMEGQGFNAKVFLDGKEVAFAIDEGCGGSLLVYWKDNIGDFRPNPHGIGETAKSEIAAIAAAAPPEDCGFCDECKAGAPCSSPLQKDADWLISDAVEDFLEERKLKSLCKKQTVIRLPEHKKNGTCLIYKAPYTPAIRERVLREHPSAEIVNERYAS